MIGIFIKNVFICSSYDFSLEELISLVGKSDIPLIIMHSTLFALHIYAIADDSVSAIVMLFSFNSM